MALKQYKIVSGKEYEFNQKTQDAYLQGWEPTGNFYVIQPRRGLPTFYQQLQRWKR